MSNRRDGNDSASGLATDLPHDVAQRNHRPRVRTTHGRSPLNRRGPACAPSCSLRRWPATRRRDRCELVPEQFTLTGTGGAAVARARDVRRRPTPIGQVADGVTFASSDPADRHDRRRRGRSAWPTARRRSRPRPAIATATAEVTVVGMDKPFEWSFRNHVESVLAKAGCNSGACHGALAGKKGFKLSLGALRSRWPTTSTSRGRPAARRVVLSDPGRSLVLTKPTRRGAAQGRRAVRTSTRPSTASSPSGSPPARRAPADDDPRLDRLEILPGGVGAQDRRQAAADRAGPLQRRPRRRRHALGQVHVEQRIGRPGRARMGLVQVVGHGEAAIKAWYLSRNVMATISVRLREPGRRPTFSPRPRGATSSTSWCWRSCKA